MGRKERQRVYSLGSYHRNKKLANKSDAEKKRTRAERNRRHRQKKQRVQGELVEDEVQKSSRTRETGGFFVDDLSDVVEESAGEGDETLQEDYISEIEENQLQDDQEELTQDITASEHDLEVEEQSEDELSQENQIQDDPEDLVSDKSTKTISDFLDPKGRVRFRQAKIHLEDLLGQKLPDVAAYVVNEELSQISQKRIQAIANKIKKQVDKKTQEAQRDHRSASLVLNLSSSKRKHEELCSAISVTSSGLIVGNTSTSIRISSEPTCRRERDKTLQRNGFEVRIGLENPAIRWVDPIPLLSIFGSEILLYCTGIDAVEEKRGTGSEGRHSNNAYLWPLISSHGIAIHSPKSNLLFIRGVKEHMRDTEGSDSLVKELIRVRTALLMNHPSLTAFHSGDSFELKHEFGIHSKVFPSVYWKTCHKCMRLLASSAPRLSHLNDAELVSSRMSRFLNAADSARALKIRRWISNVCASGQGSNCMLPQNVIDLVVPDILHLEINVVKCLLIQVCLTTLREKNRLNQMVWSELRDRFENSSTKDIFHSVEQFCVSRSNKTAAPNIHILGKTSSSLLEQLPGFFLHIRQTFFYRPDTRNDPVFRKSINLLTITFLVLRRIFLIATQSTISQQDQVFSLVNVWPHHEETTSSVQLLWADCELMKRIMRSYFDVELITDSIYTLLFTVPPKNDVCRSKGTTIGACQMQGSEQSGGRAAFIRKHQTNHSSKTDAVYNAEGSVLRRHFLQGIARRDLGQFVSEGQSTSSQCSSPQSDPGTLQLRVTDNWLKKCSECIICSRNHTASNLPALCAEITELLNPSVAEPERCAHWNDIEWLFDPTNLKPPFQAAAERYRSLFCPSAVSVSNSMATLTSLSTSIFPSSSMPPPSSLSSSAVSSSTIHIPRIMTCSKCKGQKKRGHQCPNAIAPLMTNNKSRK